MRALDHLLQRWRIGKAVAFVRAGDRLLDVGCHDRVLIDAVLDRVHSAVGVDPEIEPEQSERVRLIRGRFPDDTRFEAGCFDCITLLAVLEHVPDPAALARACQRVLAPGGRVVVTVPHPAVDAILELLIRLRLADGMEAEAHHGYDVARTVPAFEEAGLPLRLQRRFQLGLNRLFVFEKPAASG